MAEVQYKRRIGDRREGRQIHTIDALTKLSPFTSPQRSDALATFAGAAEVTETERWLREVRAGGFGGMGMLHLLVAAYIRTLSVSPALNRFVSGQRIFSRHEIEVVLHVRRTAAPDSPQVAVKMVFDPSDTVYDVYRKLGARVDEIMADTRESDAERVAANLIKLPRLFLRCIMGILKLMDYYGWLPETLVNASPWHGSVLISDMGPAGSRPFDSHLYNFGNLPLHICFGEKRRTIEVEGTGRAAQHEYIDYSISMDRRVCDSLTFASAFRYLNYYLENPRTLETPPERIAEDVF